VAATTLAIRNDHLVVRHGSIRVLAYRRSSFERVPLERRILMSPKQGEQKVDDGRNCKT
jgi:hypothetical protein